MIRLFCGYDPRESVGFHVFVASVLEGATQPVAIHALDRKGMPAGSNAFTYSRFLVPWLCGFKGHAIFLDGADMLMRADIAELDSLFDPSFAVQVVKHPKYTTAHPIKYRGTTMQCPNRDYPRKNWASAMLINCEHGSHRMSPGGVKEHAGVGTLQFNWLQDDAIGSLPARWNVLVDEGQSLEGAAVLHWTAGIPAFPHYKNAPGAALWHAAREQMLEVA